MIVTHLAVSGVGRFRTRHVVKGLGPGLNLLCAPNEHGKSTLFRALQTCLFTRHGSSSEDIRLLSTLGAQLPASIEVGFQLNGAHYKVHKSFMQSRSSRLFKDDRLIAEGRPADEEVWRILGVQENGRSVDESTFGLLWVKQGASFDAIRTSDTARSTLSRLIEAEVGQVLGGVRGERVRQSIASQLAREETDTGRPRAGGDWKRAVDAEEQARASLAQTQETLRQLESDLQALERMLRRQRELEDAATAASMRAELERTTQERDAAERAHVAAEIAGGEEQRAALEHERAVKQHEALAAIDARIRVAREQLAERSAERAGFEEECRTAKQTLTACEARLAEADAALATAERARDRLARLAIAAAGASEAAALRKRLDDARAARDRRAMLSETLARDGLSAKQMQGIEDTARDLELRRQQQAARAPQVTIRLEADGAQRVRVQGEAIDGDRSLPVTGAVQIAIDGIAAIDIVPAASADDARHIEEARKALETALRKAGVSSLAEARARRAATEAMESERRELEATLRVLAPSADGADGLAALERRAAAAAAPLADLSEDEVRAAAEQPEKFAAEREQADQRRAQCREAQAQAQAALLNARTAVAAADMKLAACRNELARLEASLETDIRTAPDTDRAARLDALAEAVGAAARHLATAREKAAVLRAAVPSDEQRAALSARVKRLGEAIRNRESEQQRLREDIAASRARIAANGGQGLGQRAAELEETLAIAERERARIEAGLAALRLLRNTIDACRDEAREAYLTPIKRGMQPFLHTLFPGAEAQFDETLAIESLRRGAPEAEPFGYLSHGTREQIAIMVRLAFGGLLAARGQPAPVLLDDALVFSDDDRIECMFDVLTQAAEKHQVIVLTCRSRAFGSFGGRQITVEPEEMA